MKFRTIVFVFIFTLFSQPVLAIKVLGLYQATVAVNNESAASRNPALKKALIQVLVKLTGDRNIEKTENISALTANPERFVQQFRYTQSIDDESQNSPSTKLWVQFDETALNGALRNYGLSIWGKERPAILVWLAHENTGTRRIVSFEESPEYLTMLDNRASYRGISLLFPLLDLEDSAQMNVSDVWAGFKEPILNASERYQSDIVLTGKLIQLLPTLWETQWTAYSGSEIMTWNSQGDLPEIVLEEGVDGLADRLASRYANIGSTRVEAIELVVSDINNLDGYAKALSYLQSLQSVTTVKVKRVTANEVMFELISHGGLSVIEQSIMLGKTLELVSNNENLNYRLLQR